jgi:glycosyltransferase involved in cell wall biosynthesis
MRVAIDVSQIVYGTGVSHYLINLVKNLLRIDSQNEYLLYAGSLRRKGDILNVFPRAKVFPIPPRLADLIWNKLHILPIEKLIGQVDLIHTSDWAEPPSAFPKVTTIHDLIPLKFSKITPQVIVSTHKDRLTWVAKESKRIIVPSSCTKNDLVELGFDENIIRVIPEAPNLTKASIEDIERIKKKFGIHGSYIISVGTKPWKNIEKIIDAFHLSKFGKNLKLLVIGEKNDTNFQDERGVRFLGHVTDNDFSGLLTGSKALVYASLYEGFGLPILDAFNCGVPVVTSNISSMPEVAGDAAVLVNPGKVNEIADGIEKVLRGPKGYIEKGLERVKEFSWEKNARETLSVYMEALQTI